MQTPTPPPVRYAKSDDINIAYQVSEANGPDLVYVSGWISHLDMMWEDPYQARFLHRLSQFSRLIMFDKRGVGLSDRVSIEHLPTMEQRMDDVRAVMDSVGCEEAYLFGHSEGAVLSTLFAATYPERTLGLMLYGGYAAKSVRADYPWAPSPEAQAKRLDLVLNHWPDGVGIEARAPSMIGNQAFFDGFVKYARSAASPAAAHALALMNDQIDIRDILGSVAVPTLIVHRTGDRSTPIEGARYMAERMPDAVLVELGGEDHLPWTDDSESILSELEEFVTGTRPEREVTRVLSTVLFTDIVDSTVQAVEMGDHGWRRLLDQHDALCRKQIEHHRGRLIKTTGDGILATFDGPARAIRCGQAIALGARDLEIEIRAGLHTGEIELRDDDIGGVAVHFASRVMGFAGSGEVVVSRTVKDLVAGSGLVFTSIGEQSLKGIPGVWELFSVQG